MADVVDPRTKFCTKGTVVCQRMSRQTSLSFLFRLFSTFVLTAVVIETTFILTGVLILSSSPVNRVVRKYADSVTSGDTFLLPDGIRAESSTEEQTPKPAALITPTTPLPTNATEIAKSQKDKNKAKSYYKAMVNYYIVLDDLCAKKARSIPEKILAITCPCISPFLEGSKPVQQENIPTIGELELTLTDLRDGGYFRPPGCRARHKVTIIVPFRDREDHLRIFLNHMHPFLQRQLIEYRIFVVEEVPGKIFNKAMMMNIGFVEAMKVFNDTDCVVFHDVDMLPENDRNLYACIEKPRHMGAFVDKWEYKLPYSILVGGAISMTPDQFRQVNGYSNEFFGWGGEDDDFYQRTKAQGLTFVRYPREVSKYTMLKHLRDKYNPVNKKRAVSWKWRPKLYSTNGLNSLKYSLTNIELRPLYTWIQADIDIPKR